MSCLLKPSLLFALAVAVMVSGSLCGQALAAGCDRGINSVTDCDSPDAYEEEWKENNVVIPPVPKDSDFKPLAVTEADERYRYYLAESSITRGEDDVMRYSVAVVSENGARNIFYEGLRCATDEIKTYAYASKRGVFRSNIQSRWRPLANKGIRAYQEFLLQVIICDSNGYAWDAAKARRALNRQYLPGGLRRGSSCRDCDNYDAVRND